MNRPSLFTIGAGRVFSDALVATLLKKYASAADHDDGLALARGMVLLPNQRAVVAVRDAFVRAAGDALLLPRLVALGSDDFESDAGGALDRLDDDFAPLPPAIGTLHRRSLMADMVARVRGECTAREALHLADTLGRLIDELTVEEIPLSAIDELREKKDDLAQHWQQAFGAALALIKEWPDALSRLGLIDRAARRNAELNRTAERWRCHGIPARWMVAAGISSSAPAIAKLLRVIADVDTGAVVLSYLDCQMPDEQWQALGDDPRKVSDDDAQRTKPLETHPQFHLKLLLDRMGVARGEVEPWPFDEGDGHRSANEIKQRETLLRDLLAPAQFTADWGEKSKAHQRKLDAVRTLDLANPAQEAQVIALAMREVLETPGKTAALVTPDRTLAARVAGHLARWQIEADDSAGQPLFTTPPAQFFAALTDVVAANFGPVELVSLLSHPLIARDDGRREWMDQVRLLDKALRGPRPAVGLDALNIFLPTRIKDNESWAAWWRGLSPRLAALGRGGDTLQLSGWIDRLRLVAEDLAGDALWAGHSGRALALWIEDVSAHADAFSMFIAAGELPGMIRTLMDGHTARPPQGGHPRLKIWGLLEARLQRADRVILAGLNEGQWPAIPSPDPWLSPAIRRDLGLGGLERRIGLASHDFATALGAPEVLITRSKKGDSGPTIASRLRLRMDALLGALSQPQSGETDFAQLAAAVDQAPLPLPYHRPAFAAPPEMRPKILSATNLDVLHSDPFSFFASKALRLRAWDKLNAEPTAPWRGTAIHAVLERWIKGEDHSEAAIEAAAWVMLNGPAIGPVARRMWSARLIPALRWTARELAANRQDGREPIIDAVEESKSITLGSITLTGKPDRIDRLADGSIAIVDYKTGKPPAPKRVNAGYAMQLGLLGLLAKGGAFTGSTERVSQFEYWSMGRADGGFGFVASPVGVKKSDYTAETFIDGALDRLNNAVDRWLVGTEDFVAQLAPEYAVGQDYFHLMRHEEWQGQAPVTPGGDAQGVTS